MPEVNLTMPDDIQGVVAKEQMRNEGKRHFPLVLEHLRTQSAMPKETVDCVEEYVLGLRELISNLEAKKATLEADLMETKETDYMSEVFAQRNSDGLSSLVDQYKKEAEATLTVVKMLCRSLQ